MVRTVNGDSQFRARKGLWVRFTSGTIESSTYSYTRFIRTAATLCQFCGTAPAVAPSIECRDHRDTLISWPFERERDDVRAGLSVCRRAPFSVQISRRNCAISTISEQTDFLK